MVVKLIRPSIWIGAMMLAWGTIMSLMGIVQHFSGARAALGAAEAGFFPTSSYLLTIWYRRLELQSRASSTAGAFSGLLGFALQKMNGIGGLAGWRWIFLIEGIATVVVVVVVVVVGMSCFRLLPNSPETADFLRREERRFLAQRLRNDAGTKTGQVDQNDKFHWPTFRDTFADWKL
ncbi:hypothetical protein BDV33DRAFT_201903 [Aspergillus novoparasiticus]|uniref:Major facilitator superfamily domain-containing protein n=1 Tax=Aspergillus novoparasiticus TaxID=986946 RepID=A0A5N6EWH6_9EURO|nr:hypothetical protein BDV33DRAFT_201903 [Aspergillus novoparasiticus]